MFSKPCVCSLADSAYAADLSLVIQPGEVATLLGRNGMGKTTTVANHHTLIERGQVVWQGNSVELAAQPQLWQRYIGV